MPNTNVREFFRYIKEGRQEKVEHLLRSTPSLIHERENGLSSTLFAAYNNQPRLANFLAEKAVALNIFEAAATGRTNSIVLILARDPQLVNAYSDDGYQPLGLACFFGNYETAQYLINTGARLNSPSQNRMRATPLHSAAAGGHAKLVLLLLEHGADPNALQAGGLTPLHAAAQKGDLESIRTLLFHGADSDIQSNECKTALNYAMERKNTRAVSLLKEKITKRLRSW